MPDYDELAQKYRSLMGPELGTIYHLLWNDCAVVHLRWAEFVSLFGSDPTHFTIMNSEAPGFFRTVQDTLFESVLLNICRFTDPAVVGHRSTLSLSAFLNFTSLMPNIPLTSLVDTARAKSSFARDWRNRRLAHTDLRLSTEANAEPLQGASRALVHEALTSIVEVLSAVEMNFTGSELWFNVNPGPHWGGLQVISCLRLAQRLHAERNARLLANQATEDDLDWAKWTG